MTQVEIIDQRAIGFEWEFAFAFDWILRNEFPIKLSGANFEQLMEGRTNRAFVLHAQLFKFL